MNLFTEYTIGLLDSLKIEKAHVLGWSMGTNIALNLAINYPNRVNKLVQTQLIVVEKKQYLQVMKLFTPLSIPLALQKNKE